MSSSLLTGVLEWMRPGPCVCQAMTFTPANSSMQCFSQYSWKAREVASPLVMTKGSSNASVDGKRPGV